MFTCMYPWCVSEHTQRHAWSTAASVPLRNLSRVDVHYIYVGGNPETAIYLVVVHLHYLSRPFIPAQSCVCTLSRYTDLIYIHTVYI